MSNHAHAHVLSDENLDPVTARPTLNLTTYRNDAKQFYRQFKTVILGTVNPAGDPQASYAVCLDDDSGDFYTFLSELSAHTHNLMTSPRASLLFIEDESKAKHPFARRRLNWNAQAAEIDRGQSEFDRVMDLFEEKHGGFMKNLRGLSDFHLFRLSPGSGSFVAGFAKAFAFSGSSFEGFRHMNDKGHQRIGEDTKDEVNG